MTVGVYAGSFDPITRGHLSVIEQASLAFDHVIVAVGVNSSKKHMFEQSMRIQMITEVCEKLKNVEVNYFHGLLATFCKSLEREKVVIVRGLRAVSDFESEMSISHLNGTLAEEIPTVFFPTPAEYAFVSSSAVRELLRHKADIDAVNALDAYVTPIVKDLLLKY